MLAGCSGSANNYHHSHAHKHGYMTKDPGYKTYKRAPEPGYYHHYRSPYHNHHYRYNKPYHHHYHHHMKYQGKAKAHYVHHDEVPKYPYTYHGNKYGGHVRMTTQDEYGNGYAAGCRTAHTGMMYRDPKLLADSQHYQMGWETGFNHCHYDRAHVNGEKDKYAYIPY